MKIEHLALNVADPASMAAWYVAHLGMAIVRSSPAPPHVHFIEDDSGAMMLELYHKPEVGIPSYEAMDPFQLHLAFVTADPDGDRDRLTAAGARLVDDRKSPDGSHLVFLRDPWGVTIQLCKRARPMLRVR
jgi:glyoxylase I family protein